MLSIKSIFLVLILSFSCCASQSVNEYSAYNYHERVGVPKAEWLSRSEGIGRIVGGTQVPSASVIPHQAGIVAVLTTGWSSVCGGSLASSTRVITAAHCWFDGRNQARQFTVVLGSVTLFSGGTRIISSDVLVHPNWNANAVTHDVAIVSIVRVDFTNNIQAVPLPSIEDVNTDFSGMSGTVSGFGMTSDAQNSFPTTTSLQQTTVDIMTNVECRRSFNLIHGSHLCTSGAGRVGTCEGDSGGPLTVVWGGRRVLVGIVSFGLDGGCESGTPSVYTRVTAFLAWLQSNL